MAWRPVCILSRRCIAGAKSGSQAVFPVLSTSGAPPLSEMSRNGGGENGASGASSKPHHTVRAAKSSVTYAVQYSLVASVSYRIVQSPDRFRFRFRTDPGFQRVVVLIEYSNRRTTLDAILERRHASVLTWSASLGVHCDCWRRLAFHPSRLAVASSLHDDCPTVQYSTTHPPNWARLRREG